MAKKLLGRAPEPFRTKVNDNEHKRAIRDGEHLPRQRVIAQDYRFMEVYWRRHREQYPTYSAGKNFLKPLQVNSYCIFVYLSVARHFVKCHAISVS